VVTTCYTIGISRKKKWHTFLNQLLFFLTPAWPCCCTPIHSRIIDGIHWVLVRMVPHSIPFFIYPNFWGEAFKYRLEVLLLIECPFGCRRSTHRSKPCPIEKLLRVLPHHNRPIFKVAELSPSQMYFFLHIFQQKVRNM
jgi:hypothetical protein